MYVGILDQAGTIVGHENVAATPEAFLRIIAPYREDSVVAVECIFTWYWLADLCAREGIAFVLGHALYIKASTGAKPRTTSLTPIRLPCSCAAGCCPKPCLPARDAGDAGSAVPSLSPAAQAGRTPGPHSEH